MSRAARPERPAYQAAIEVVWTNLPQAEVSGRRSANVLSSVTSGIGAAEITRGS